MPGGVRNSVGRGAFAVIGTPGVSWFHGSSFGCGSVDFLKPGELF